MRSIFRVFPIIATSFIVMLTGCNKDEEGGISGSDAVDVSEESVIEAYYHDLDDQVNSAIAAPSESEYSGGRKSGSITLTDDRFKCSGVVVTLVAGPNSTVEHPYGTITIDFGLQGCQDGRGNIRKGKLILDYDGWRNEPGSVVTLTTEQYWINGVVLQGTRTSTNVTENANVPTYSVTLRNGKAIMPNGVAERESDITWSWVQGASPEKDKIVIEEASTASGVSVRGNRYTVSLSKQLEYQRSCPIAISGVKKYDIEGGRSFSIDFGDGSCDKVITVSARGISRTLTLE